MNTPKSCIYYLNLRLIKGEKMDDNILEQPKSDFLQKLNHIMLTDEVYLDKDLKIWDLCLLLNTKRDRLIKILKEEFKQDFNTFINTYRIIKAKKLLSGNQKFTIQEIAEKSGYYSVSEFIKTYKKIEKKYPVIS